MRRLTAALFAVALLAVACGGDSAREATAEGRQPFGSFGETSFHIEAADGTRSKLCCGLVADERDERRQGMRAREDFGGYDGMVFVYQEDTFLPYTMSTVPIPLSIAWFDIDGLFIGGAEMTPCPAGDDSCPSYPAPRPYRYSLEVRGPAGLDDLGVGQGARLVLTDEPCPKAT